MSKLGLTKLEIENQLSHTSISDEDKIAIASLIILNNKKIESDVTNLVINKLTSELRKSGMRI